MPDQVVGALMLIISVTTAGTPAVDPDDTHVMTFPYSTMAACRTGLAEMPLSDTELQTERTHAIRTLRACVEPGDQFWYTWTNGHMVAGPDVVVETGSFTRR